MMDGLLYCVCNMEPRKIFGPRVPQSLNPALPMVAATERLPQHHLDFNDCFANCFEIYMV